MIYSNGNDSFPIGTSYIPLTPFSQTRTIDQKLQDQTSTFYPNVILDENIGDSFGLPEIISWLINNYSMDIHMLL